jgi:hypothetical protein
MENIVYMPIHYGMSEQEIKDTVDRTIKCFNKLTAYLKQDKIAKPKSDRVA